MLMGCGGNVCDKTIALYEDAAEQVQKANNKDELRQVERKLNADYSLLLRENSAEIAELEQKAAAGDAKAVEQLEKVRQTKRAYIDIKYAKRKQMDKK